MVYNTRDYWVFGLCPSYDTPKDTTFRNLDLISVHRWRGERHLPLMGPLEYRTMDKTQKDSNSDYRNLLDIMTSCSVFNDIFSWLIYNVATSTNADSVRNSALCLQSSKTVHWLSTETACPSDRNWNSAAETEISEKKNSITQKLPCVVSVWLSLMLHYNRISAVRLLIFTHFQHNALSEIAADSEFSGTSLVSM
jgi:hypothetical protein